MLRSKSDTKFHAEKEALNKITYNIKTFKNKNKNYFKKNRISIGIDVSDKKEKEDSEKITTSKSKENVEINQDNYLSNCSKI
jgi:hypothetical protein